MHVYDLSSMNQDWGLHVRAIRCVFTPEEFAEIKLLAETPVCDEWTEYKTDNHSYKRWEPSVTGRIKDMVEAKLFQDPEVNKILKEIYPWDITKLEVQVTKYEEGDYYGWHNDNVNNRVMNYVFNLNNVEGGVTQFSDELYTTKKEYETQGGITVAENSLILMSSVDTHRVNTVTKGVRLSVNGHLKP